MGSVFLAALLLFLGGIRALAATFPEKETIDLGDGVTMEFILIHPGTFQMGSAHDYDELPVHRVTFTQPFYLGKFEVTQEQWEKIMGSNPSHFKGARLPVDNVSWEDCRQFIAAVRRKTGRNFALPTEAQWEYACRAGTTTAYSCGDDETLLGEHAWYAGNAELTTHPVGSKKPNPWGLHDMHGNVFEWCADWYEEGYPPGDAKDPVGPDSGDRRTLRGGAWLYVTDNLRSSDRGFSPPDYRSNENGFRCALLVGDIPASAEANAATAPTEKFFALLDAALAEGNKLSAEFLLTELERLAPNDPRLTAARPRIAALAAPPEQLAIDLADGVRLEFVLIRPGIFTMGSDEGPLTNEKPAHRVTLTRPFYLGKFEVTQKQWTTLMGRNLSAFRGDPPAIDGAQLPVENVSWHLCQSFLARLQEKVPGRVFRLPTEAEWEYACRAGSSARVPAGPLEKQAWFGENAGGRTHPVGQREPNAWGLYDMFGNVWEWCQDQFGPYSTTAPINPAGPTVSSSGTRVARGGAWNNLAQHVNATFRHDVSPEMTMRYYGFRVVAEVVPSVPAKPRESR